MQAYSLDLRQRVLTDCDAGLKTKAVAQKYGVSRTWVRGLKQRRRETGEIAPRQGRPGRKPKFDRTRLSESGGPGRGCHAGRAARAAGGAVCAFGNLEGAPPTEDHL